MNNTIGIKSNFPEIAKKLKTVSKDIGRKATARALNKTVTQGRTEMARAISREFRVSATTARERLRVSRASITRGNLRLEATLLATSRAKGRSMNLIAFVAAGAKMTRKGRSRIKFRIKRGGGAKLIPGVFIGNKGRTTVFIREPGTVMRSRARYAGTKHAEGIRALGTIDVPQMFNTRRIKESVRKVMLERFEKNFDRELRTVMEGWAK